MPLYELRCMYYNRYRRLFTSHKFKDSLCLTDAGTDFNKQIP